MQQRCGGAAQPGLELIFFGMLERAHVKHFFCKVEEVKRANNKIDKEELPEKEKTTEDSEDAAG